MNNSEISYFRESLEKNAFIGLVRPALSLGKKLLLPKRKSPLGERVSNAVKGGVTTGGVVGTVGVGGLGYGAIAKPKSIRSIAPGGFEY